MRLPREMTLKDSISFLVLLLITYVTATAQSWPYFVPKITQQELDTIPWSRDTLTLQRREHRFLYYNYTRVDNKDKPADYRWLARETIPYHKRVIRSQLLPHHADIDLTKRGFTVNPFSNAMLAQSLQQGGKRKMSWKWKLEVSQGCPIQIFFCFEDADVRKEYSPYANLAIRMWNEKLGPNSAVRLGFTPADPQWGVQETICQNNGRWGAGVPNDVVILSADEGDIYSSTVGWAPGTERGRMRINWRRSRMDPNDPNPLSFQINVNKEVGILAHEIGHILGLEHEHQRYDADKYIQYNVDNLAGINNLPALVQQYNALGTGFQMRVEDVKYGMYSNALSKELEDKLPNAEVPQLHQIMPFVRDTENVNEMVDYEPSDDFDWLSIMMYDSRAGSEPKDRPVMVRADNHQEWGRNYFISQGDVRAIKKLYPDLVQAGPSNQGP